MNSLHQVMVAAAPGDAVTNSAIEIRRLLRQRFESQIYALHIHDELVGDVLPLSAHPAHGYEDEEQMTVVHVSMGDPQWLGWVLSLDGSFILSYHNISPEQYFRRWDRRTADLLSFGRATLGVFANRTVLALADSAFNGAELSTLGYTNVVVGGLIVDVSRMSQVPPDVATLREAIGRTGPTLLHVGQLYPHKRADFLLTAFRRFLDEWQPNATLVIAGASRLSSYRSSLETFAQLLGLERHVRITGPITEKAMAAYYRTADVMVTASEHEGFCVPLIEAMSFNVPVVARDFGAIRETAGGAAMIVSSGASPTEFGSAVAAVLQDREFADRLRNSGRVRVREFSLENSRQRFFSALTSVLPL